jgi:hypothetical protein
MVCGFTKILVLIYFNCVDFFYNDILFSLYFVIFMQN